jgi:LPXTG-motif cell wall-anchored protein
LDNLADCFTLNTNSIKVTVTTGDTSTVLTDDKYNFSTTVTDYDFEVAFADITDIEGVTVTAASVFEVEYSAKLTNTATIGGAGNKNQVDLEFTNNPYGTTTGAISDHVIGYTYELVINKVTTVDGQNVPLTGAGFTLYKKAPDGSFNAVTAAEMNQEGTSFTFKGLDTGVYKLKESTVPAGYNGIEDIEFSIEGTYTVNGFEELEVSDTLPGEITGAVITAEITNLSGSVLPETGAMGTMWLILGGAALVILAAVFMITRKKMSIYED